MDTQEMGRFGHHPDPAIDFCVEVEELIAITADRVLNIVNPDDEMLEPRIAKAMAFVTGGDQGAIKAKAELRALDNILITGAGDDAYRAIGLRPPDRAICTVSQHGRFEMNDIAPHSTSTIPAIGAPFGGGFFGGLHPIEPNTAIIVAPKAEGEAEELTWGSDGITTARSLTDGFANSEALNDEDHPAAHFCRSLRIGGHDDWYLPALDEMTVLRRNLMPGSDYVPEQTTAEAFREGGAEAFEREWYWTSTEFSKGSAWIQVFTGGYQSTDRGKGWGSRVRAVRKCQL